MRACDQQQGQEQSKFRSKETTLTLFMQMAYLCILPVLGRSADRVFARSSAVGSNILHPACRVACAADWIVFRTPILLANSTTCCFRLDNRFAFDPKPTEFTSTLWLIIACS